MYMYIYVIHTHISHSMSTCVNENILALQDNQQLNLIVHDIHCIVLTYMYMYVFVSFQYNMYYFTVDY